MSRMCDNCKKVIPLGDDYISVRFIGVKEMEELFHTLELDFCSLKCLVLFWSKQSENM